MTDYRGAKLDWLELLQEEAESRGQKANVSEFTFLIDDDLIGKVRATWNQASPLNLGVSSEVEFMGREERDEVSHLYLVLLDIDDPHQFNPSTDDFYPIRESILKNDDWVTQKASDGRYLLKIDPYENPVKRWRNDWSLLFSPRSAGEKSTDSGPGTPPDDSKVAELQDIAKGLEDGR